MYMHMLDENIAVITICTNYRIRNCKWIRIEKQIRIKRLGVLADAVKGTVHQKIKLTIYSSPSCHPEFLLFFIWTHKIHILATKWWCFKKHRSIKKHMRKTASIFRTRAGVIQERTFLHKCDISVCVWPVSVNSAFSISTLASVYVSLVKRFITINRSLPLIWWDTDKIFSIWITSQTSQVTNSIWTQTLMNRFKREWREIKNVYYKNILGLFIVDTSLRHNDDSNYFLNLIYKTNVAP